MCKTHLQKTIQLLLLVLIISCSKSTNGGSVSPTNPVIPPTVVSAKLMTLPKGWKLSSTLSASFPSGVELYYYDSIYAGRNTKMYCLAYDSKITSIEFKPVLSSVAKKPSDFFKDETGVVYACINAGYFGANQSFSLVKYNGTVLSPNIKVLSRNFNGVSTSYYATRAAFGITASGSYEAAWVYHVGSGNDNIYAYPKPNANVEGAAPMALPTELFPAGGAIWNAQTAIGGSPMLIKNGKVNITDTAELISINNTTSRPRTAIGSTASSLVLLLAVEGDNTLSGTPGMNLAELTTVMQSLGCIDAINLDGGGSTNMVVSNQQLVRPGDNGVERAVVSAILIKKK